MTVTAWAVSYTPGPGSPRPLNGMQMMAFGRPAPARSASRRSFSTRSRSPIASPPYDVRPVQATVGDYLVGRLPADGVAEHKPASRVEDDDDLLDNRDVHPGRDDGDRIQAPPEAQERPRPLPSIPPVSTRARDSITRGS